MVKKMYPRARRPNLLEEISVDCTKISGDVPSISNIECLCRSEKQRTPLLKAKGFPGVQSSISCLKPASGNAAHMPYTVGFPVLPPISQIGILSSRTDSSSEFDERKSIGSISNVTCLNGDVLSKDMAYSTELPSGRMAKKHFGINPYDSEFVKLCKMNGRKDLLRDMAILNKTHGSTQLISNVTRDFDMTNRRTMLRSPNEAWKPSEWGKFGVYRKCQLR